MSNKIWYIQVAPNGEIINMSLDSEYFSDAIEAPEDFDPEKQDLYIYENGTLHIDERLVKRKDDLEERNIRRNQALARIAEIQAKQLLESSDDPEIIKEMASLITEWTPRDFEIGEIVSFENLPYKALQTHDATGNPAWTPKAIPALWKPYLAAIEEWPLFVQPTGAHNAYQKGDKVTFNGEHYISLMDGNSYSPSVYPAGWQKQ